MKVPGVLAVLTAEDAQGRQPRLDADVGGRRADGAGRRQGAVSEPGSRVRRGDRPLCRRRRCRGKVESSNTRRCRWWSTRFKAMAPECAGAARGHQGQESRRPRPAQAPQPHFRMGGRRQGSHRRGLPKGRGDHQGDCWSYHRTHPSPLETCQCVVSSFDKIKGELTIWGTFQAPHVIRTVVALICENSRAQDPCDRSGYRRRLRQQGRRLSRLHLLRGGLHRYRQAGEVGRGPHREPDIHHLSPATIT